MIEKIHALWPEITLFAAACVVMVVGLSRNVQVRRLCVPVCFIALVAAGVLAWFTTPMSAAAMAHLPQYGKTLAAFVGALLLLLLVGTPDREYEDDVARGRAAFEPIRGTRGEFYAFYLFSITGLMLCAGADDLIWLFLALELTSLPTYIMVAISTGRNRSMEAGVKYFFLGALGAATFLFGFALIYGATGSTKYTAIAEALQAQYQAGPLNAIAVAGVVLAVLGIGFKIAAVPMHFYTADVYQGASAPVSAMLAFVPKAAGFFALLGLLSCVGWFRATEPNTSLPEPIHEVLWFMAVLTMTVGNVLAVMQNSVKRILAYSSIAHSGYMLVGLIAGPGLQKDSFTHNGLAAVLFYLLVYGVSNIGAFAVLACLERRGRDGQMEEADDIADLRGLCSRRPLLGWIMVISSLGLLGLPPLLGFWGKMPLFTAGVSSGDYLLVVILGLNSAIAAFYYLRLVGVTLLEAPDAPGRGVPVQPGPFPTRVLAGVASVAGIIMLSFIPLTNQAQRAGIYNRDPIIKRSAEPAQPAVPKPEV